MRSLCAAFAVLLLVAPASAEPSEARPAGVAPSAGGVLLDRVAVRFVSRETGGADSPRFIFERQLAFEARIEALSEGDVREGEPPFRARHVRAALERHVAETVLESLATDSAPKDAEVSARVEQARIALLE
jgi:hypothetical protein